MIIGKWSDHVNGTGSYFYDSKDGLIIAHVYNMAHTNIYGAKLMATDELIGHYISLDYAKKAIETYFDIENRTLIE